MDDDDTPRPLTTEELALARELLDSYRAARAMGRMVRVGVIGLAALAATIAAWDQIAAKWRSLWPGH
jgi:hypothetical protein